MITSQADIERRAAVSKDMLRRVAEVLDLQIRRRGSQTKCTHEHDVAEMAAMVLQECGYAKLYEIADRVRILACGPNHSMGSRLEELDVLESRLKGR